MGFSRYVFCVFCVRDVWFTIGGVVVWRSVEELGGGASRQAAAGLGRDREGRVGGGVCGGGVGGLGL